MKVLNCAIIFSSKSKQYFSAKVRGWGDFIKYWFSYKTLLKEQHRSDWISQPPPPAPISWEYWGESGARRPWVALNGNDGNDGNDGNGCPLTPGCTWQYNQQRLHHPIHVVPLSYLVKLQEQSWQNGKKKLWWFSSSTSPLGFPPIHQQSPNAM